MYRDEMEALRARINTLEAQLDAEELKRAAAEADAVASRAASDEQRLAAQRGGVLPHMAPVHAWPVAMVVAVSTVSCLYLGMQWSQQWHRSQQLQRRLLFMHYHHPDRCPSRSVSRVHTIRAADVSPTVQPPKAFGQPSILKNIQRLARQNVAALRGCYARSTPGGETLRLQVRARVRHDGSISAAMASGGSAALQRCIEGTVRGWHLGGELGRPQTVAFPLTFKSSSARPH